MDLSILCYLGEALGNYVQVYNDGNKCNIVKSTYVSMKKSEAKKKIKHNFQMILFYFEK